LTLDGFDGGISAAHRQMKHISASVELCANVVYLVILTDAG